MQGSDVPRSNPVAKERTLVQALPDGATKVGKAAQETGPSTRHSDYYLQAARRTAPSNATSVHIGRGTINRAILFFSTHLLRLLARAVRVEQVIRFGLLLFCWFATGCEKLEQERVLSQQAEAATRVMQNAFKEIYVPGRKGQEVLGLKDYRVFGTDPFLGVVWIAASQPTYVRNSATGLDTASTYAFTVPFWVAGQRAGGASETTRGELIVNAKCSGVDCRLENYTFHRGTVLTIWHRTWIFFFWSFVGPFVGIFLLLWLLLLLSDSLMWGVLRYVRTVLVVLVLPVCVDAASICYTSVSGAVIAVVLYCTLFAMPWYWLWKFIRRRPG
jgi:hypothetical protein